MFTIYYIQTQRIEWAALASIRKYNKRESQLVAAYNWIYFQTARITFGQYMKYNYIAEKQHKNRTGLFGRIEWNMVFGIGTHIMYNLSHTFAWYILSLKSPHHHRWQLFRLHHNIIVHNNAPTSPSDDASFYGTIARGHTHRGLRMSEITLLLWLAKKNITLNSFAPFRKVLPQQ